MELGDKIKMLREQKDMTLEELGNAVGVGKSTVRKWENGMIANMRRDKIAKVAAALDVSPGYLMGWEEGKETLVISKDGELSPIYEDPQKKRLMAYCEKLSRLTPEHQIAVTTMIDFLASEEAKKKEIKSQSSKEA